jgi:phage tail sheath protein FI
MAASLPNLPGVRIQEIQLAGPPITGGGTSTAGFVGMAPKTGQFTNTPRLVTSTDQFSADYVRDATTSTPLSFAVQGFFQNGGTECYVVNTDSAAASVVAGIKLLEPITDVEIIGAPGSTDKEVYTALQDQATTLEDRFAILDSPLKVSDLSALRPGGASRPNDSPWSAFYYPRIQVAPLLSGDSTTNPIFVAPTGHVAGIYARVDANKGVHKAPANEVVLGALGVEHRLTDADQNAINGDGVDAIRIFPEGPVVWGARTLLASSAPNKTFLYINVRRLTTYIEQSLKQGLRFAVFEPNNLPLRQTITRSVRGLPDRGLARRSVVRRHRRRCVLRSFSGRIQYG